MRRTCTILSLAIVAVLVAGCGKGEPVAGPGASGASGASAPATSTTSAPAGAAPAPGPAIVTVNDRSKTDNFHLTGPGVNKKTGVKFRGAVTWTLKLKAGKHTVRSDAHKKLRRTFMVTPAT